MRAVSAASGFGSLLSRGSPQSAVRISAENWVTPYRLASPNATACLSLPACLSACLSACPSACCLVPAFFLHHPTQLVAQELGQNIHEEELEQMILEFDVNKDGFIDEAEFVQIMTQSSLY